MHEGYPGYHPVIGSQDELPNRLETAVHALVKQTLKVPVDAV